MALLILQYPKPYQTIRFLCDFLKVNKRILAYPNYGDTFDVYTDASTRKLGVVIPKIVIPLYLFSLKFNKLQQRYSITELELLSIV